MHEDQHRGLRRTHCLSANESETMAGMSSGPLASTGPHSVRAPACFGDLPRDRRGYPVIATVSRHNDVVDFGSLSERRKLALATFDLCAVCGKPFGQGNRWQVAMTREVFDHSPATFNEAPVHEICALYAAQVCPFVSSPYARLVGRRMAPWREAAGQRVPGRVQPHVGRLRPPLPPPARDRRAPLRDGRPHRSARDPYRIRSSRDVRTRNERRHRSEPGFGRTSSHRDPEQSHTRRRRRRRCHGRSSMVRGRRVLSWHPRRAGHGALRRASVVHHHRDGEPGR